MAETFFCWTRNDSHEPLGDFKRFKGVQIRNSNIEIRMSKYETNSNDQIKRVNPKHIWHAPFGTFEFGISNLFRISTFGFRVFAT